MVFSEPPAPAGSEILVLDASGRRVDRGDTTASDEENGLRVSMSAVGDGGYTVAWTATSAVDGHVTKGSFAFAVGSAPLPVPPDVGEATPPPRPLEIAGRALSFCGIALLIGAALFGLVVRRDLTLPEEQREQLLLAAGGGLVVIGAVSLLLDQGGQAPPRLSLLLTSRGAAGVVVLAAAAALAPRRLRLVALASGCVAAALATAVSHAAASASLVQVIVDLAHALAASAWSGGVAAMLVVTLPSARSLAPGEIGRLVGRFSTAALAAVAVLVASAIVQALERLVLVEDLWETPYGIAILVKIALFAAAMAFAAFNLLRWGPRLRAGRDGSPRRWLGVDVAAESALAAAILVATGVLTALVPTAQPTGAAFDEVRHAGGLRLELLLASTTPGQNRYVLRVSDGPTPVTDAVKVALRFTMIEHDMGETELLATQRAQGEYVATGGTTSMFGTWRIQAIVRRPGSADVTTTFEAPITAQPGAGAVAKVVAAPPYTLVVYHDPPQAVAGAPLTLNVVVVDQKGDPVAGRVVTVVLSGPAVETVNATETSVGHYEAALPAPAAGSWTARIAVGSEGAGDYAFEVAR